MEELKTSVVQHLWRNVRRLQSESKEKVQLLLPDENRTCLDTREDRDMRDLIKHSLSLPETRVPPG